MKIMPLELKIAPKTTSSGVTLYVIKSAKRLVHQMQLQAHNLSCI